MKILFLTRYAYPHFGGVEKHIFKLKKELVSNGHKVKIISKADIKYPEIKIIGLLYIWYWLFKNIDLVKKSDVIHCHDVFIWYLPFRFIFPNKKVFITFHGYESYPIKLKAKIIRKVSEKLSSGNICIGEFMKKWYGTKPTHISYGAVDINKKTKRSATKYDAIFSGRFDEQTAILTYLEAAKEIKQNDKFNFLALGDGKYFDQVKDIAITKGWVKNPESYLRQSKFAFADRYLSILEAFADKKLVFSVYDNPVKRDYLYMTPYKDWIIISKNSKELIKNILYYRKNKKEASLKMEKAYRWVQGQTWHEMANIYINLWKNDIIN